MVVRKSAVTFVGFTLLELLVAIAILAILFTLMAPVVRNSQTKIRATVCLGNLRQWGIATQLYASDHDDFLPNEGPSNALEGSKGWYVSLPQSLGQPTYFQMKWRTNASVSLGTSLWICPSNTNRSNGHSLFHYCLNGQVDGTGDGDQPRRLGTVPSPSATVWLFDNGGRAAVARQNNVHTNLHSRGAQFLFLDGHVRRFTNKDYWDYSRGHGKTNHPELVWSP